VPYIISGIVVVFIIALIIRHFKAVNKRVYHRIDILTTIGNMVGYFYILYKENITPQILDKLIKSEINDERYMRIVAATNYLFARGINPMHSKMFSTLDIQNYAYQLLNTDNNLCELVVQSDRLTQLLYFHKTNTQMSNGLDILAKYGQMFPVSPNPDSYHLLIKRFLSLLNERYKEDITKHIIKTWPIFYEQYFSK
jgi:hypothetical protein